MLTWESVSVLYVPTYLSFVVVLKLFFGHPPVSETELIDDDKTTTTTTAAAANSFDRRLYILRSRPDDVSALISGNHDRRNSSKVSKYSTANVLRRHRRRPPATFRRKPKSPNPRYSFELRFSSSLFTTSTFRFGSPNGFVFVIFKNSNSSVFPSLFNTTSDNGVPSGFFSKTFRSSFDIAYLFLCFRI